MAEWQPTSSAALAGKSHCLTNAIIASAWRCPSWAFVKQWHDHWERVIRHLLRNG